MGMPETDSAVAGSGSACSLTEPALSSFDFLNIRKQRSELERTNLVFQHCRKVPVRRCWSVLNILNPDFALHRHTPVLRGRYSPEPELVFFFFFFVSGKTLNILRVFSGDFKAAFVLPQASRASCAKTDLLTTASLHKESAPKPGPDGGNQLS